MGALQRDRTECSSSDEPIWGLAEDGSVRFPWRFPVEPIVALDPARGIPGTEVAAHLGFLKRLDKKWGVYLQRSLNARAR